MKKIVLIAWLFLFVILSGHSQSANLSVVISNIRLSGGNIKIGVFNSVDSFKNKSNPVTGVKLIFDDSESRYTFKNLFIDTLAIAVYHDENADDSLNTKKLGIPIEGVGFSGIQHSRLSKPKFEEASFIFRNDTTITIQLVYPKKQ